MLALATTTVVGVGFGGVAYAEINNPPGYVHLKNLESGQCLMANAETGAAQQWRCLNATSEEWASIPVELIPGEGNKYFMLASHWTTMCLAVPNIPVNGTKVVQAACNVDDTRQYWQSRYLGQDFAGARYHIRSLQGALCLEKPDGNSTQGTQLQMRACASQEPHWDPTFDYHREQWWSFIGT